MLRYDWEVARRKEIEREFRDFYSDLSRVVDERTCSQIALTHSYDLALPWRRIARSIYVAETTTGKLTIWKPGPGWEVSRETENQLEQLAYANDGRATVFVDLEDAQDAAELYMNDGPYLARHGLCWKASDEL
jgi:hypothetical protein